MEAKTVQHNLLYSLSQANKQTPAAVLMGHRQVAAF